MKPFKLFTRFEKICLGLYALFLLYAWTHPGAFRIIGPNRNQDLLVAIIAFLIVMFFFKLYQYAMTVKK